MDEVDPAASVHSLGLVQRARSGDGDAYDELFARAFGRVQMFCRLRLGRALRGRLDSGDVLQEAYLEAHQSFERFHYHRPRPAAAQRAGAMTPRPVA